MITVLVHHFLSKILTCRSRTPSSLLVEEKRRGKGVGLGREWVWVGLLGSVDHPSFPVRCTPLPPPCLYWLGMADDWANHCDCVHSVFLAFCANWILRLKLAPSFDLCVGVCLGIRKQLMYIFLPYTFDIAIWDKRNSHILQCYCYIFYKCCTLQASCSIFLWCVGMWGAWWQDQDLSLILIYE